MPELEQIGSVQILVARTYTLDPKAEANGWSTEAVVLPGVYPLFEYGSTRFWLMAGEITVNSFRLGDGTGIVVPSDRTVPGLGVTFPSKSFGPDDWRVLIQEPICKPGPEQRLMITVGDHVVNGVEA